MTVHCKACGHEWDAPPVRLPMPIARAVTAMKGSVAAGCPRCGAYGLNVICGAAPGAVTPAVGAAVNLDDETIVPRLAAELAGKGAHPMELVLRPETVFQLTALVQLAGRHPAVSEAMRETADRLLAAVREYFVDCPTVLDVVRRGDDPTEDR